MKDNTIIRIKVPKALYESVSKQLIKEEQEQSQDTVTISLDEYTGSNWEYELGKWAADNWPAIASALKSGAEDPGQQLADLGGQILTLATAGTVAIGVSLAVAKDSIVDAAKKVKEKLSGKKPAEQSVAVAEGMGEVDDLDTIISKIPQDKLGEVKAAKPQEDKKKEKIKEYESSYKMIDGQCYRVDDEGNRTKVNHKYCQ